MIFTENNKVVRVYGPIDATGATMNTTPVCMKGYNHVTFILQFGVCSDTAATSTNLIAYKALTAATCTNSAGVAFATQGYRAEITGSGDTLEALTAMPATGVSVGHGNTLDITTGGNFIVVEIDGSNLSPTVGAEYDWVSLSAIWAGQATLLCIAAILSEPRYSAASMPTAIA